MKRFGILMILAVVVGGIIGGIFIGGITLGKSQGQEEITREMQDRTSQYMSSFFQSDTQSSTDDQEPAFTPPTGAFFGRGGSTGTVEKIEGNIVTVKTMSGNSVNIVTGSDTTFQKTDEGTLNDIEIGATITVSGETQEDGSIEANSIYINPGTGTLP